MRRPADSTGRPVKMLSLFVEAAAITQNTLYTVNQRRKNARRRSPGLAQRRLSANRSVRSYMAAFGMSSSAAVSLPLSFRGTRSTTPQRRALDRLHVRRCCSRR